MGGVRPTRSNHRPLAGVLLSASGAPAVFIAGELPQHARRSFHRWPHRSSTSTTPNAPVTPTAKIALPVTMAPLAAPPEFQHVRTHVPSLAMSWKATSTDPRLSLRIPSSPPTLELSLNGSTAVRHLRCSLATSRRPMQSDMPLPMPAISSVRTHPDLVTVEHSSSANSLINTVRVGSSPQRFRTHPLRPWGRWQGDLGADAARVPHRRRMAALGPTPSPRRHHHR